MTSRKTFSHLNVLKFVPHAKTHDSFSIFTEKFERVQTNATSIIHRLERPKDSPSGVDGADRET